MTEKSNYVKAEYMNPKWSQCHCSLYMISFISHEDRPYTVSPYSSMENHLPAQYCVGTKYEKIEILCLDKIF